MKNELNKELLKISQLAKATGTNVTTLKYYIKEGLIQPECKTNKNMAYYNKDCIQRVNMIRSLQKEHYYPLSVIKGLLDNSTDPFELEFMDAVHKADLKDTGNEYSAAEAAKLTGLNKSQIDYLSSLEIITKHDRAVKTTYSYSDIHIMRLTKRRLDAGIPFEQSAKAFYIYQQALQKAASSDVDCFILSALLKESPSAQQAARMIIISDETLDSFVSIKRNQLNRFFGSERINQLYLFGDRLADYLASCAEILNTKGYTDLAGKLESSITYCPPRNNNLECALAYYSFIINNSAKSLTKCISLINEAQKFFLSLSKNRITDIETLLTYALKLGWFVLSPALMDNRNYSDMSESDFAESTYNQINHSDEIVKDIINALKSIR
ncbi:MAG TPA: MerR family transcriptional regulator [Clostridia bacterium]|nr:MerR family transcriptional regulator [Clostridia bacterium]